MNVALAIAEKRGGLYGYDIDGACLELVNDVLLEHPEGEILWVDLVGHPIWKYHAVPVLAGLVHDAWRPELPLLPPEDYVCEAFGEYADGWEMNPGRDD